MHVHEFRRLLALVATLTREQCARLRECLDGASAADAVGAVIEGRLLARPCCPKCQSPRVVRNGHANGLQRYQCRGCAVTFNALTGTPLARLRQRVKWLGQAQALHAGLSVRKAAAEMGVHRTTAFRWRHRFVTRPCLIKASGLAGVAEADETYLLRSYKGQPRRLIAEQVRAARALGIEHHAVNTSRGERRRGPWHIQNVNAYHSRFKPWLMRFHGVATSYLPNYLGWFRALDRNAQTGAEPASLLALAIGA